MSNDKQPTDIEVALTKIAIDFKRRKGFHADPESELQKDLSKFLKRFSDNDTRAMYLSGLVHGLVFGLTGLVPDTWDKVEFKKGKRRKRGHR